MIAKIRAKLGSRPLLVDGVIVLLIVLFVALYLFIYDPLALTEDDAQDSLNAVYRTGATVAASLLGLMMATVTLMVTLLRSERLSELRDSGHQTELTGLFFSTIKCLGVMTIVALIGLLLDTGPSIQWSFDLFALAGALIAGIRVARSISMLQLIVNLMLKANKSDD